MLMYVARSMNLWASTDMRLTISPTVEDFLAALVITRACGTKERERGWVWWGTARAPVQAHVEEGDSAPAERSPPSPPLEAYLPSQPVCLVTKARLLSTTPTASPILSSSLQKGPQRSPKPCVMHLSVYVCTHTPQGVCYEATSDSVSLGGLSIANKPPGDADNAGPHFTLKDQVSARVSPL